jgi:putative ABC transport system permease protein
VSPPGRPEPLKARALLRPYALLYLYRRRLRVHRVQEALAALGVAVAVALVFAVMIANGSIAGSADEVVHAVVGPANLQMRSRDAASLPQSLLKRVEHLPGVLQAAPLLEQTGVVVGPEGHSKTAEIAGTELSLALLNGLAHTLPIAALSPGGVGLSKTIADELEVTDSTPGRDEVVLQLRGETHRLKVAAVLGPEAAGALSQARVAVMPLKRLQTLAGLGRHLSRILVQTRPGSEALVRREMETLARGRLTVTGPNTEITQLHQALGPSDQASGFFAAISVLLGFLFAFNAMLLTVPERRQAIADLRLIGTKRAAIVQIVVFQALCLGLAASSVGLFIGYLLSRGVFHQSSGYLAEAFTLGTSTVVGLRPLLLAVLGGTLATFLASAVPLLDLRRGRALDAVYFEDEAPGNALGGITQLRLATGAAALVVLTTVLFSLNASLSFVASGVLAIATVLTVPLVFAGVLRVGAALADRFQRLTVLHVALASLRAATLRSLALAATGAVAIFGSIALGGSRDDLLRGIDGFAHSYAADADLWVSNPSDNQATNTFMPDTLTARIAHLPGVSSVNTFQGGFLEVGDRRTWVIARPPGFNASVLSSQISNGNAQTAIRQLGEGGYAVVSEQLAEEHKVSLGKLLQLPTPAGEINFKLAATTTNLAWSPGAIFIGTSDYRRYWGNSTPTALGVKLTPGASVQGTRLAIERVLGPASGLEVSTARTREQRIDKLTSEGLSRLGEISTVLLVAAIFAMASALGSSIWQRRVSLAGLRLAGVRPSRLRRILLTEAGLMLGAGCVTGAVAGIYGQVIIDGYLKRVTGFPVARLAGSLRPLEVIVLVVAIVLAIVTIPGWSASRTSPTLALDE